MAKQLYDYWFVQFDFPNEEGKPYKSSGGNMVWNEKLKRNIPIGWNNGTLIDIANITMGQSPDGTSYNEIGEGVLFYQGSTDFGMRFPSVRQYTTAPSRFAKKGDILMSVRAPVGAVNIANNDCCIGRGLSALNSKIGSTTHLYYILNDLRIAFDQRNAAGTTFGSITKEDLYNLPIVIPAKEVISAFDKICSPMFDRQMLLGEEIDTLIKQRDELLPLLLNGQVLVNSDLSVYKKRRGKIPSLTLNHVSDIQILQCKCIIGTKTVHYTLQAKCLIILVVITFGAKVFVTVAWHVLLEEASQVFQAFFLVLLKVTAHNDDRPVGEIASSTAILPEADIAVQITFTNVHTKAVGMGHHATAFSVAKFLTQVEIEIKN